MEQRWVSICVLCSVLVFTGVLADLADPMASYIGFYAERKGLAEMLEESEPVDMPQPPTTSEWLEMASNAERMDESSALSSIAIELEEDPPLVQSGDELPFDYEEVAQISEQVRTIPNIDPTSQRLYGKQFFNQGMSPSDRAVEDISYAQFPRSTVVKILFGGGGRFSQSTASCSGAMIDDRTVLTAAHCLYDRRRGSFHLNHFVVPGYNDDQFPFGFFHTENPYGYARATNLLEFGYSIAGDLQFDLGAIRLDRRMSTGSMGYTTVLPDVGDEQYYLGFPAVNFDGRSLIFSDGRITRSLGMNIREGSNLNCNGFSGSNVYEAPCGDESACARVWGVVSYTYCPPGSTGGCCANAVGVVTVSAGRRNQLNEYMESLPVPEDRPYILWHVRRSEVGKRVDPFFYTGSPLRFELSLVNRGFASSGSISVSFYAVPTFYSLASLPVNTAGFIYVATYATATSLDPAEFIKLRGGLNMPSSLATDEDYYIVAIARSAVAEYSKDFSTHMIFMGTSFNLGTKVPPGGFCLESENCESGSCVSNTCYIRSADTCRPYMLPDLRGSSYRKLATYMDSNAENWVEEAKLQGCNVVAYDVDSLPHVCAELSISIANCNAIAESSRYVVANWPSDQSRSWSSGNVGALSADGLPTITSRTLSPFRDCVPGPEMTAKENFLELNNRQHVNMIDVRNQEMQHVFPDTAALSFTNSTCNVHATIAEGSFPSDEERFFQTLTSPRTTPTSRRALSYFSQPTSGDWRVVVSARARNGEWNDAGAVLVDEGLLWEDDSGGLCPTYASTGTWKFGIGLKSSRTLNVCPLSKLFPCTYLPPVDCLMSDWSEWSACSSSEDPLVGEQSRMRSVLRKARCTTPCPSTVETRNCSIFSTPNASGQYLTNRGFETTKAWKLYRATYNTTEQLTGSRSLYFAEGIYSRATQSLALPANLNVSFSCAFRSISGNPRIAIQDRQTGDIIGSVLGKGDEVDANWRRNGLQIKTPTDGIFDFRVEGGKNVNIWIDDCSVTAQVYQFSVPFSNGELIKNGGFEAVGKRWNLSNGKAMYSMLQVRRGNYALRFTDAATASQTLVFPGGNRYEMRCFMRGSQDIALKAMKEDGSPMIIEPYSSSNSFVNEGVSPWRRVTIRFETPEDNRYTLLVEAPVDAFGYVDACSCKQIDE